MKIENGVLLSPFSSFHIGGPANALLTLDSIDDVKEAVRYCEDTQETPFILGGGSNTLFGDEGVDGAVLNMHIPGIDFKSDQGSVLVVAGAGVSWDALVEESVSRGLSGLENLSGIPGTVGASPIQNIGAYGREVGSLIEWVEVYDRVTKKVRRLDPTECHFGYRDSIWKRPMGKSFIVTRVAFRLSTRGEASIGYIDLKNYFGSHRTSPTPREVRQAVLEIRSKKFPSLEQFGTAGSFFKNPILAKERGIALQKRFPLLPVYDAPSGGVKVSAAWIIDHVALMRGVKVEKVGTYAQQALVIVTERGAKAHDILTFAHMIADRVFKEIDVVLDPEVQFVGCSWKK
jgi:UDP-N-acetylmuramate dehydrogenase